MNARNVRTRCARTMCAQLARQHCVYTTTWRWGMNDICDARGGHWMGTRRWLGRLALVTLAAMAACTAKPVTNGKTTTNTSLLTTSTELSSHDIRAGVYLPC